MELSRLLQALPWAPALNSSGSAIALNWHSCRSSLLLYSLACCCCLFLGALFRCEGSLASGLGARVTIRVGALRLDAFVGARTGHLGSEERRMLPPRTILEGIECL